MHQILHRRCDSSVDLSHIARTTRPSSLASGPGSGPGSVWADAWDVPTIVSMSMDRLRHPAFWHFTTVSVDGGGFDGFCTCAQTFATKSVSYRAHGANACCFAHGNIGVDFVVAGRDAREDVDVWEVVVPCEGTEDQSEMEVRTEGGRERSHGGCGCRVGTAAAKGGTGSGRGVCHTVSGRGKSHLPRVCA